MITNYYNKIFIIIITFLPFNHALAFSTNATISNLLLISITFTILKNRGIAVNIRLFLSIFILVFTLLFLTVIHILVYGEFNRLIVKGVLYFVFFVTLWTVFLDIIKIKYYSISKYSFFITIIYSIILFADYIFANYFSLFLLDTIPRYSIGAFENSTSYFGYRSRGFSSEPSHVASIQIIFFILSLSYLASVAKICKFFYVMIFAAGFYSSFSTGALFVVILSVFSVILLTEKSLLRKIRFLLFFFLSLSLLYLIFEQTHLSKLIESKVLSLLSQEKTIAGDRGSRFFVVIDFILNSDMNWILGNPVFLLSSVGSSISSILDLFMNFGFLGPILLFLFIYSKVIRLLKFKNNYSFHLLLILFVALFYLFISPFLTTVVAPFIFSILIHYTKKKLFFSKLRFE